MKNYKKLLSRLVKDENGGVVSGETLIMIFGGIFMASVIITALTVMLAGENKDGKGGLINTINNKIDDITSGM